MSLEKLPVNWFDMAVVVVLLLGIWRGRKHGMSEETMPLLKWLIILFGAAIAYEPLGQYLESSTMFSRLFCYVVAYLALILVVFAAFSLFKHAIGGKLIGSDVFGRGEYYLGMAGGMVRFGCVLLAVLAVLNARAFSQYEIQHDIAVQQDVYGSDFFPKLYTVQQEVFEKSAVGPLIKKHLSFLLIRPTPPGGKALPRPRDDLPGT